jgi:hypothetical protein
MTSSGREIRVDELREATRRLLDAPERRLGSTVQLQAGAYWGLFAPDMFASDDSQPEVLGRSLTDDVSEIRSLAPDLRTRSRMT